MKSPDIWSAYSPKSLSPRHLRAPVLLGNEQRESQDIPATDEQDQAKRAQQQREGRVGGVNGNMNLSVAANYIA